jgi:hypothetical protein
MFSTIATVIKIMLVIVPLLAALILAGWLAAGILVARNGKKLLARFTSSGLPYGPRAPWPPQSHGSGH